MFDFSNLTTAAILEIIVLMLVAAIIGFLIAWIYWRQKYRSLEGEFATYRGKAEEKQTQLSKEIQDLKAQLSTSKEELDETKKKLHALQMIQIKYDTLENKYNALNEENAKLQENYSALLTKNAGLGAQVQGLEKENKDHLAQIKTLNSNSKKLKADIKGLNLELDSLKVDYGKVEAALAACRAQDSGGYVDAGTVIPTVTTGKKKKSTGKKKKKSKKEVLEEVASKRDTINYDLIGTAAEEEKQDLKVIKGIGPFIEQKLHALGIYTFAQIARFDDDLIEKVTKALEAFPGRIQRDDWIGQAKELST